MSKVKSSTAVDVAIACLKQDKKTNPLLIEALQKIAGECVGRERVFDAYAEQKRIERQRTLWTMPIRLTHTNAETH